MLVAVLFGMSRVDQLVGCSQGLPGVQQEQDAAVGGGSLYHYQKSRLGILWAVRGLQQLGQMAHSAS